MLKQITILTLEVSWDGFDDMFWGFNKLKTDIIIVGRSYSWICWLGPITVRKVGSKSKSGY